jgi:hypothetical protein
MSTKVCCEHFADEEDVELEELEEVDAVDELNELRQELETERGLRQAWEVIAKDLLSQ